MEEEQNKETTQVNQTATAPVNERKGFNITSMVLGIIAILFCCVWYINIPCAIIAIIFSIAGRKDAGRGMGIAGLVLGIVALALYAIIIVLGVAAITGSTSSMVY